MGLVWLFFSFLLEVTAVLQGQFRYKLSLLEGERDGQCATATKWWVKLHCCLFSCKTIKKRLWGWVTEHFLTWQLCFWASIAKLIQLSVVLIFIYRSSPVLSVAKLIQLDLSLLSTSFASHSSISSFFSSFQGETFVMTTNSCTRDQIQTELSFSSRLTDLCNLGRLS